MFLVEDADILEETFYGDTLVREGMCSLLLELLSIMRMEYDLYR